MIVGVGLRQYISSVSARSISNSDGQSMCCISSRYETGCYDQVGKGAPYSVIVVICIEERMNFKIGHFSLGGGRVTCS